MNDHACVLCGKPLGVVGSEGVSDGRGFILLVHPECNNALNNVVEAGKGVASQARKRSEVRKSDEKLRALYAQFGELGSDGQSEQFERFVDRVYSDPALLNEINRDDGVRHTFKGGN